MVVLSVFVCSSTAQNTVDVGWWATCPTEGQTIRYINIDRQDESQMENLYDGFLVKRREDNEGTKSDIYRATVTCQKEGDQFEYLHFIFEYQRRGKK